MAKRKKMDEKTKKHIDKVDKEVDKTYKNTVLLNKDTRSAVQNIGSVSGRFANAEGDELYNDLPKKKKKSGISVDSEEAAKRARMAAESVDEIAQNANTLMQRMGLAVRKLTSGIGDIATKTVETSKDLIKQYGRAIGEDISVNKKNFMTVAISKSTPLIGYAITKFMDTEVYQRAVAKAREKLSAMFSAIGEKFKSAFSFIGGKIKGLFTRKKKVPEEDMEEDKKISIKKKKLKEVPKMQHGGLVQKGGLAQVHKAEIIGPIEKVLGNIDTAGKDKAGVFKKLSDTMTDIRFALGHRGVFYQMGEQMKEERKGILEGFLFHFKRELSPGLKSFEENVVENLIKLRVGMVGQIGVMRESWQKTLAEHPVFRTLIRMTSFEKFWWPMLKGGAKIITAPLYYPIKFLFTTRGGYKSKLPKTGNMQSQQVQILGMIYSTGMHKLDIIGDYLKQTGNDIKTLVENMTGQEMGQMKTKKEKGMSIIKGMATPFEALIKAVGSEKTKKKWTSDMFTDKKSELDYREKKAKAKLQVLESGKIPMTDLPSKLLEIFSKPLEVKIAETPIEVKIKKGEEPYSAKVGEQRKRLMAKKPVIKKPPKLKLISGGLPDVEEYEPYAEEVRMRAVGGGGPVPDDYGRAYSGTPRKRFKVIPGGLSLKKEKEEPYSAKVSAQRKRFTIGKPKEMPGRDKTSHAIELAAKGIVREIKTGNKFSAKMVDRLDTLKRKLGGWGKKLIGWLMMGLGFVKDFIFGKVGWIANIISLLAGGGILAALKKLLGIGKKETAEELAKKAADKAARKAEKKALKEAKKKALKKTEKELLKKGTKKGIFKKTGEWLTKKGGKKVATEGVKKGVGGILSKLIAPVTAIVGTAYGAAKAQGEYGDVIGEKLSWGERIGLGTNKALKSLTLGALDAEKITGAKDTKEQVMKRIEDSKNRVQKFIENMSSKCAPGALKLFTEPKPEDPITRWQKLISDNAIIKYKDVWYTYEEAPAIVRAQEKAGETLDLVEKTAKEKLDAAKKEYKEKSKEIKDKAKDIYEEHAKETIEKTKHELGIGGLESKKYLDQQVEIRRAKQLSELYNLMRRQQLESTYGLPPSQYGLDISGYDWDQLRSMDPKELEKFYLEAIGRKEKLTEKAIKIPKKAAVMYEEKKEKIRGAYSDVKSGAERDIMMKNLKSKSERDLYGLGTSAWEYQQPDTMQASKTDIMKYAASESYKGIKEKGKSLVSEFDKMRTYQQIKPILELYPPEMIPGILEHYGLDKSYYMDVKKDELIQKSKDVLKSVPYSSEITEKGKEYTNKLSSFAKLLKTDVENKLLDYMIQKSIADTEKENMDGFLKETQKQNTAVINNISNTVSTSISNSARVNQSNQSSQLDPEVNQITQGGL